MSEACTSYVAAPQLPKLLAPHPRDAAWMGGIWFLAPPASHARSPRMSLLLALTLVSCLAAWQRQPVASQPRPALSVSPPPIRTANHPIEIKSVKTVTFPADWRVRRATLGRGGTISGALQALGVPDGLRANVQTAVASRVNVRRLPPHSGLSAVWDGAGALRSVALRCAAGSFVRLTLEEKAGEIASVEAVPLPVTTTVETLGSVVHDSIGQALAVSPYGHELASTLAEILQWDVDLMLDSRPGDRVQLVFEVRSLGAAPPDLPGFGGAPSQTGEFIGLGRVLAARYAGTAAQAAAYWVGGGYYDDTGRPLQKTFLKSPLNYRRISSGFSSARRNPVTLEVVPHHGVDFAAAPGTPVVSTADGKVVAVGWEGALGRAVRVRHGSEYVTIYGHLQAYAPGIREGVEVRQSDVVGFVGSSGRSTGPHLHYTILQRGRPINPLSFRGPDAAPLPTALLPELQAARQRWGGVFEVMPADEPARLARQPVVATAGGLPGV
ncbi:MAG TPA: M23 family metallopeptidase [Candidatus Polarisedimenticolaceae bacterium]|nr:M23 family metallopeptidase [Candidatus Polarisedimenticolaceae bacterium]